MNVINKKLKQLSDTKVVRFYLLVGLAYAILWLLSTLSAFPGTFLQAIGNNVWRLMYVLVFNFIFLEYSLPFVLRKRRYLLYNILLVVPTLFVHAMIWSYGLYGWTLLGMELHVYAGLQTFTSGGKGVSVQMAYSAGSIFFFGIARHIYNHIKLKQATQQLRIGKQEAELNYLKSQTNPHFLFNTLNNIYSLARDKSDLAPESILRLSKILRFMLYEAGGDYIPIEQEMKIMTDYIALEKLRYDETLSVNFNHDIEDTKVAVPPLLLIPLVENAFKHGVSETRGQPFVDIYLSTKNRQLQLLVKNSSERLEVEELVKENIGLSNLRRQLELLFTDYDLSVQQDQSVFTATLKINLASHV